MHHIPSLKCTLLLTVVLNKVRLAKLRRIVIWWKIDTCIPMSAAAMGRLLDQENVMGRS